MKTSTCRYGTLKNQPNYSIDGNNNTILSIIPTSCANYAHHRHNWYEPAASIAGMVDPWGFVLVGLSSTVSGIQYVLVWSWRARDEHRARAAAASEEGE